MCRVYIIVLNWNGHRDTIECIESLIELDYPDYHIVICDNNSQDSSVEKIQEWAGNTDTSLEYIEYTENTEFAFCKSIQSEQFSLKKITLVQTGKNLGFAGGNNIGIKYSLLDYKCGYVWILNNDTIVEPEALSAMVERSQQDKKIGICGSKLIYYHDRSTVQAWGGATYNKWTGIERHLGSGKSIELKIDPKSVEEKMDYVVGASMIVSTQFIKEIGLLNESYFLYYEEIDWSTRSKNMYGLAYADKSVVYHKEGASTGSSSVSKSSSVLSDMYHKRSLILYTKRYFPIALPVIYLRLIHAIFQRLLKKEFNRALVIVMLMKNHNYKFY